MWTYIVNGTLGLIGLVALFFLYCQYSTLHYSRMGVKFMRVASIGDMMRLIYANYVNPYLISVNPMLEAYYGH
jgi:hypothetical protein